MVALVLFSLGSLFALYEGVHKLQHPEEVNSPLVALGILGRRHRPRGFLAAHGGRGVPDRARGRGVVVEFIRHAKAPELPVVLLEDIGAIAGLFIAFAALLAAWKIDPIFDGVGTVLIGGLLGVIAVVLAVEMKSLLIGESMGPEQAQAIRRALGATRTSNGSSTSAPSTSDPRTCWWPPSWPSAEACRRRRSAPASIGSRPRCAPWSTSTA